MSIAFNRLDPDDETCPKCGAILESIERWSDTIGVWYMLTCPACGWMEE